jgi:hypothetical protein
LKDKAGFYDEIFNKKDDTLAEKILMSWKLLKYIEVLKKDYKKKYNSAKDLSETEKNKIYKYDFLLHSEYFILNIFKDFLKNKKYGINVKNDLLDIISKIDNNDQLIQEIYQTIKNELAKYINKLKSQPGYYHNKFFKNEKSIGLIRNELNKKYNFIEVIQ